MDFDNRVLFIVRSFVEYDRYDKSDKKAIKLIHKYHPEISIEKCGERFYQFVKTYRDAIIFVDENKDHYWKLYQHTIDEKDKFKKESDFIDQHSNVPECIITGMIGWIFDWHHVR